MTIKEGSGWSALAAAILATGYKDNDKEFLNSEWCSTLKDVVALAIQRQDRRMSSDILPPRTRSDSE